MSTRVVTAETQGMGVEEVTQTNQEISSSVAFAETSSKEHAKYMYVRENGVIEKANNPEEIVKMCPALGKLAIEAPDQFDAMLALSEMTSQRIATESKQEVKTKTDTKKEPTTEIKADSKQKNEKIVSPENQNKDAGLESTAQLEPAIDQDVKSHPGNSTGAHVSQFRPEMSKNDDITPQIVTEAETEQAEVEAEAETAVSNQQTMKEAPSFTESSADSGATDEFFADTTAEPLQYSEQQVFHRPVESQVSTKNEPKASVTDSHGQSVDREPEQASHFVHVEPATTPATIAEETPKFEQAEIDDHIHTEEINIDNSPLRVDSYDLLEDARELVFSGDTLEPTPWEEADSTPEIHDEVLDEETQDIHDALLEIITAQESDVSELETIPEIDLLTVLLEEAGEPSTEQSLFENYLEQIDTLPVEPLAYETIKGHAEDQPVEETLAELVQMLAESNQQVEELAPGSLTETLEDIEQVLEKYYYHEDTKTLISQPELTPALTKHLVLLLREVGYLDPKEALTGMVQRHNLAFLLQALDYLCKLKNEENRQEFLVRSKPYLNQQDNPKTIKVSKLIALVLAKVLRPSITAGKA